MVLILNAVRHTYVTFIIKIHLENPLCTSVCMQIKRKYCNKNGKS